MEFLSSHKTGFLRPLLAFAELYGICSSCCGEIMGRITKRFFNDDGKNGASCLFIGSYKRMDKN